MYLHVSVAIEVGVPARITWRADLRAAWETQGSGIRGGFPRRPRVVGIRGGFPGRPRVAASGMVSPGDPG